ncbi:MAG: methylated-DNA--[protein]-cysteine S-methyltransferase [Cyanobacteria bacterium]|nr:methylated-DNA--[protein]-cysteine S-methyltransferase [Cyanobacteriota bacterium]
MQSVITLGTPIGRLAITILDDCVTQVSFLDAQSQAPSTEADQENTPFSQRVRQAFQEYFSGNRDALSEIPVDFSAQGTPFQRSVWQTLRQIPVGETRSYQWVAGQVGSPKSSRAVGQANRVNPLPILVPCHRVVQSSGKLGGYLGQTTEDSRGLAKKQALLSLEATV